MNIDTQTSIVYHVEVTQEEARALVLDPAPLVKALRQALAGPRTVLHDVARSNGHIPKQRGRRRGKGQPCPYCTFSFVKAGNLRKHIETVHPEHAATTTATLAASPSGADTSVLDAGS